MKSSRVLLALVMVLSLSGIAYVSQRPDPPAARMAVAAQKFLDSLTAEQKKRATFTFDDPERTNWEFVPMQDKDKRPTRKGLALQDMSAAQKQLALALVAAGTSEAGNKEATTIMGLVELYRSLLEGLTHQLIQNALPPRHPDVQRALMRALAGLACK